MFTSDSRDTIFDFPAEPLSPLLQLLPVPVWMLDSRSRILGWNDAAARMFGLPPDAVAGQSATLFVPTHGLPMLQLASQIVRESGEWLGELRTSTATGTELHTASHWVAVGPANDPGATIIAVFTDIGENRSTEASRSRAVRWQITRTLVTAMAEEPATERESWLHSVRNLAANPDPVASATEFHGRGDGVLVAGESRVFRELTRSLLEAAGYAPLPAADAREAVCIVAGVSEPVRAAVLAFGSQNPAIAESLRRYRPKLSVVMLDSPSEWNAAAMLQAVAEAVSADHLGGSCGETGLVADEPLKRERSRT